MEVKPSLTTLQRFFRLLKDDRKLISYIYIYAIFGGIINLTLPLGIQAILGFIQGGAISASWWLLILVVTAGTLLAGVLVIMQTTVSETLQRRIFTRVSFDFAERLPNLKTEAIRREHVPELMNRFFDTLILQKGLPKILIDVSTAFVQILFGLILLSFYHPLFIFFGLVLLLLLLLIFRLTYQIGLKTSLKESKYKYEVAYWLEEVARTLQTFKLAGKSELPLQKTDALVSNYLDAKEAHFKVLLIQYFSIATFKTLVTLVLLALGSYLVINNQINLGQFVASELIIILILSSAEKLIVSMDTVYDVLTSLEKIGGITDLPLEVNSGVDFSEVNTQKGISLELSEVTHQFPDAIRPTLENITFQVKAGEKVAIAGYNGSGKTTLVQIISCFLNDYEGSVLYNGIPRNNFNQPSLRRFIGDYSSEEDIFKGTIRENIALGSNDIKFEDIVNVTEKVGLKSFISRLPNGFDTVLLPEGKNLPRSVVAKIKLARSLATNPQLLAVEELMANIDYSDRVRIANLLTDKSQPWTLIAVTDDPVLASKCDRILIMKQGKVVEDNTFENIQRSEHYNKIFKVDNL